MTESRSLIIAIDGPAAAGKGTMARRISNFYMLAYLDTGRLYRGIGWIMLNKDLDPRNEQLAEQIARGFSLDQIKDVNIRTPDVGRAASVVATNPGVRAALLSFQRNFATAPPDEKKGAVLDGRDIGTVVCPDAHVKLYITASPEERAHRRWLEFSQSDANLSEEQVLEDVKRRDARDSSREAAPLKPSEDSIFIDTTAMSPDTAFARARREIDRVLTEKNLLNSSDSQS